MNTEKLWSNIANWFTTRTKTSGFLLSLFIIFIIFMAGMQRYQNITVARDNEMNLILKNIYQNIDQSLDNCYTTTVSLALSINDEGIPQNFDLVGKKLLQSNSIISAVELIPNGVIKYIYPIKGNEALMNLDILGADYLKEDARITIEAQKIYFAGPIKLKRGGTYIVGRLPIYNGTKFWGFTGVIIKLKTLINVSGINSIDKTKYEFQFSKINPVSNKEEFFLPSKTELSKSYYKHYSIPHSKWKLYLIAKEPIGLPNDMIIRLSIGLILAITIGFMTSKILKKPKELKLLLKEQEEKLLRHEMKFKSIFEQSIVGFALVNANTGYFIEGNDNFCDMLGYTRDELKEKSFDSLTHPDDVDRSKLNFKKLAKGKIKDYITEKRYITKAGNPIWVNLTVSPLWEPNKKPTINIAFFNDITAKKEAQEKIEQSEMRFRTIFENSPLPLWEEDFSGVKNHLVELDLMNKDPETVNAFFDAHPEELYKCISLVKIIAVNYECLRLHKVKNKESLLDNLSQLIDPESYDEVKKQLVALSQNVKQFSIDSRLKNMEGEYRDISIRWNVIEGYEDSLERVILTTQDITERKASEKIILNSQQYIKSLVDTIDGIVWEYDIETLACTFISKKVKNILGYSVEEWMSTPTFWQDHIHPEDRETALELSDSATKKKMNIDYEYRMITKSGDIIWIRDIACFVFEGEKAVSCRGIMVDITLMKESEKILNNSLYLVTEQNKRLLNFSYIVSHNLRSHTSNIESIISLIELAESDDERNQMMHLLKSVSDSLDETMIHLNEVVNINTNISLLLSPLKLNTYISKTKEILTEQINSNEVSFIKNVPIDTLVNYNPAYLESIIYNLISNAIRYRHPERKPVIKIQWYKENNMDVIEISDNGIGIDLVKNGDKLFGMYKTFSNNKDSRGIGLFITKNQIEAMGGSITVESELNVGTTFKIYSK